MDHPNMIGNAPKAARGHHCRLLLVRHRQGWPRDRVHDQCNGGEEDVHLAPEELSDRRIGGDRQLLRLVDHVVGDSTQELHCSHGGHHTLVGADFRWPRNHCRRSQRRPWSAAAKKSHRRWDCDDTPTEDKTVMASSAGQCGSSDRYCNCGGSGHTPPHGALIAGVLLVVFGAPGALIGAIAGHWWSCGDRVCTALSASLVAAMVWRQNLFHNAVGQQGRRGFRSRALFRPVPTSSARCPYPAGHQYGIEQGLSARLCPR